MIRLVLPLLTVLACATMVYPQAKSDKPAKAKREALPTDVPDTMKAETNITYGKTAEQELKMDVYRPKEGGDNLPACVLVHGGGWTGGDKERFTPLGGGW